MWLPLAEYSIKHKVSISTLRRKIKSEDIQYRLEDGKYFIFDTELKSEAHRPSLNSDSSEFRNQPAYQDHKQQQPQPPPAEKAEGESVITAANRLLSDLKKAYTQVLHEKEDQIMSLKEEISDLRTLVKVLESENARLKGETRTQSILDY